MFLFLFLYTVYGHVKKEIVKYRIWNFKRDKGDYRIIWSTLTITDSANSIYQIKKA